MSGTKLIFESPGYLNNLSSAEPVSPKQWTGPENEELQINTEDWTISSPLQSALITDWFVNESAYQMTTQPEQEGFEKLSQDFAISMVGQLFPKELPKYLASLNRVYSEPPPNGPSQDIGDNPQKKRE